MRRALGRGTAGSVPFPAPIKGLYEGQPAAASDPLGAEFAQNVIPTMRGLEVRGGISKAAQVDGAVKSLMTYIDAASPAFFAATADAIYNITSLTPGSVADTVSDGLTGGDWASQQIGVSGGDYVVAVNGSDYAQIYDGGAWNPIGDEAISDLDYDALVSDFVVGETVTDGGSGANATIYGVVKTSATTGTLKIGTVGGGVFANDDNITSASGDATVDGTISSASSLTITGVATNVLSHVWLHQNRLWFIEGGTLKAWYLPSGQVGGAATSFSLAGIFRQGGSLLFGATWSLDTGDGMDDKCVFVSTEGEIAIYAGTDPSSASTWALEGRYSAGKPLGKRGWVQAGGDLLIATDDGIIPLSAVISKSPAELSLAAVTRPIETTWKVQAQAESETVELHRWTSETLMLTVFPSSEKMLTANIQTGAWAQQTGWFADCAGLYLGDAYIGRSDGYIYKLNDTGTDDGDPFTARVCWSFADMGNPTTYKETSMMRLSFFASGDFGYKLEMATDYDVNFGSAPSAAASNDGALIWNSSNWNEAVWGSDAESVKVGGVGLWRSVPGAGFTLAPIVQVTSGGTSRLGVEIVGVEAIVGQGQRAA